MEGKSSEVTEYVGITIGSRHSSATLRAETEVLQMSLLLCLHFLCICSLPQLETSWWIWWTFSLEPAISILKCLNENVNLHN